MRQLLSLGVKKTALAWGKALGIAGALGALIIPATLVGVIALALTSENGLLAASASRLIVMFAGDLLYFSIFIIGFSFAGVLPGGVNLTAGGAWWRLFCWIGIVAALSACGLKRFPWPQR